MAHIMGVERRSELKNKPSLNIYKKNNDTRNDTFTDDYNLNMLA